MQINMFSHKVILFECHTQIQLFLQQVVNDRLNGLFTINMRKRQIKLNLFWLTQTQNNAFILN